MSIPRFSTDRDDHDRRSRNVISYHVAAAGLLCLLLVAPHAADAQCPCVTQASGFAGGDGSPGDPYQVCSPAHLDNVRNHLSSHFVQTADIDMTGVAFVPIGDNVNQFVGNYDGGSLAISNLAISIPATNFVGLFGVLGVSSEALNIRLLNCSITGSVKVGALAGKNLGLVTNILINGSITATDSSVGGLIGQNLGVIHQSKVEGAVVGLTAVGGLIGEHRPGASVVDSYSNASVTSTSGFFVGGLVGLNQDAQVENCYSSGSVSGAAGFDGGLIGIEDGTPTVISSFWDTQTSGQATSAGGTGKTTAEMQMQATFDPPWDFTNIWMIDEGIDYPRLQPISLFPDCNSNGIPDECDPDCNANALPDECDITAGTSLDCNTNTIPDECEGPPCTGILGGDMDCSGTVTMTDLPDFVDSLLAGLFTCNADANGDFAVNGLDAQAFVDLVLP